MVERERGDPRPSHLDEKGDARMVDVSEKEITRRRARARARLSMERETARRIASGETSKGAVLTVARVAGIQAAKRTGELIPLCHPLSLDRVRVDFTWSDDSPPGKAALLVEAEMVVSARTGVEMEALVAVTIAALTVYDMVKSVDRGMRVESVELLEKSGGRSGRWVREGED